ncbi:hypothetical protein ACFWAY_53180 [Rhodococcus sp. NPDC059968]|uniref:hypothetical protein n=1 Tax=Rhodococcus sp. NPDC059968 TaxID=3347017 RepID=UPI00366AE52F
MVGVREAASEGRLPSRRTGSGHRILDRADLDSYRRRPASVCAEGDSRAGGGSVLPVGGLDRARGVASRSGKDVAGERYW